MRYFLIVFFLLTASLVSTQAQAARIKLVSDSPSATIFTLSGPIKDTDNLKLRELMIQYGKRERKVLFLNSEGGGVRGGVRLGHVVRQFGTLTAIGKNGRCLSACSLIFFAGWDKRNNIPHRIKHPRGKLGLHQPYDKTKGKKIKRAGTSVMDYLDNYYHYMDAGESLFDLMKRTPPTRMAYVKNRTLKGLEGYYIQTGRIQWPEVNKPQNIINTLPSGPINCREERFWNFHGQGYAWKKVCR